MCKCLTKRLLRLNNSHIETAFVKRKKNACLTVLRKAFAKCLKSLTVNSLHDASAFTEHLCKALL